MMSDDLIHFEDIVVGTEKRFGHYEVTREEVIAYAQKFDPQPFHLDDEAAARTLLLRSGQQHDVPGRGSRSNSGAGPQP